MKIFITFTAIIFLTISTNAQKVDWENAPLNPIAFKHKLEDFNLKNVFAYNEFFFKAGLLMYDNTRGTKQYYKYNDEGLLIEDSSEDTYTFNDKKQLIAITPPKYDKSILKNEHKFEYDAQGRLATRISRSNEKIIYTYNEAGQLLSQKSLTNGIENSFSLYTYSKEKGLLKITKNTGRKDNTGIEQEFLFYDRGVLVRKIDAKGYETIWKTKTDTQGNYLQEMDITFDKSDFKNGVNLSYRQDKRIEYFGKTYLETIFINEKPATFMPVFSIGFRKMFFDLFNQDYYDINIDGTTESGYKISILAKNKKAIAVKPKTYNPFHPDHKVYHIVYAGIIRNQGGMFSPNSYLNVHETDLKSLIIYDRYFETNYYLKINDDNGVYILDEALPVMFYVTEEKEQKLYHFVENGIEINPTRLNLTYANNNQDASVMVDNKPMYYIKGLKNLENKKVYYPTLL